MDRYESNRPQDELDEELGQLGVMMVDSMVGSSKAGESGSGESERHLDSVHSDGTDRHRHGRGHGRRVIYDSDRRHAPRDARDITGLPYSSGLSETGDDTGTNSTSSSSSDSGELELDDLASAAGSSVVRGGRARRVSPGRRAPRVRKGRRGQGDLASIEGAPMPSRGSRDKIVVMRGGM